MNRRSGITRIALLLVALSFASSSAADDWFPSVDWSVDHWRFQTSLYTVHFDSDPEHDNTQQLINFEVWNKDGYHAGLAFFDNSFSQPSQYLYVGKSWELGKPDHFYWRVTAGLLHGYKDEFEDKIPLNGLGVAPAIVPTLGYRYKRVFAEYQQLGLAAGMLTAGFTFGAKGSE